MGSSKKIFFSPGVKICWFKRFWKFKFSQKIIWLWVKIPICGFKIFVRNFCQKSASAIYTLYKKSWIIFCKKFGVIVIFDLKRWGNGLFLRPHKSKKGKKSTKGVQKGTQKVSDKNVDTLPLIGPKAFGKITNSRWEILIDFQGFLFSPHGRF